MAKKKRLVTRKAKKKKLQTKRILVSLVVVIAAFVTIFYAIKKLYPEYNSFEEGKLSDKYFVRGIDLSHHNPILNWEEVLNENISFAYLKASEGTDHKDRNYPYNYESAKRNNIKIGTYHFYIFGVDGKQQARHFIKTARCESGDLFPAIDVEHSPTNVYSSEPKFVDLVVKELKVMENELYEHYGFHPVIYTNKDCYKLYVKNYFPNNPIWMCDLQKEPSDDVKNWIVWQFSHKGQVGGMKEDIDLNYFRYSYDRLKDYLLP